MDTAKLKSSEQTPTARLMQAMHFGGKDLDLNRAGEMSDSQTIAYTRRLSFYLAMWGCFVIVIAVGCFYGYSQMLVFERLPDKGRSPELFIIIFLLCSLAGGLTLFVGPQSILKRRAALKEGITAFTGRIKKHAGDRYQLLIVINHEMQTEEIYTVDDKVYNAFIEGETYTLYSLSTSPTTILTAEHVSDA